MTKNHGYNTDEYDQAFAPATEQQCADIRAELKKAQARAAACADECQELAVKLKALQAQEPTMEMIKAGQDYMEEATQTSYSKVRPPAHFVEKFIRAAWEAM